MTDRLSIRIASFALSVIVTITVVVGLQTLAQAQHVAEQQIVQTGAAPRA